MEYDPHLVECRDCEWSQPMPNRETADHAKRVHEDSNPDHTVVVGLLEEEGEVREEPRG
jgi:hypothetical protein